MNIPFTQTKEYLKWHASVGNITYYNEYFDNGNNLVAVVAGVVLSMRVGNILYCPYGPFLSENISKEKNDEIVSDLKKFAKKNKCVFVRTEFLKSTSPNPFLLFQPPVKTYISQGSFQPRLEWCIDLKKTENEIYEDFSKNCKYSIRRAEKGGEFENGESSVQLEIITENFENYLEDFLNIMKETEERNGFINHEANYFKCVFNSFHDVAPLGPEPSRGLRGNFMIVCKIDGVVVNMAIIIFNIKLENNTSGELTANYVFGGSREYKRELGASFKTQWEAIKKAKKLGATVYNMGGIVGNYEGHDFGKKSLVGVTNFKKQFGGYQKFNGYFQDIPIQKIKYFLYILYKLIIE